MIRTEDYNFYLPEKLIAQSPILPRDHARLMVMDKKNLTVNNDFQFFDLVKFLKKGDVLVLNNTRVSPYRLNFVWQNKVAEILLVKQLDDGCWAAMVRHGKFFKIGQKLTIWGVDLEVKSILDGGLRKIKFYCDDTVLQEMCRVHGKLPLPPYIADNSSFYSDYNTVFAGKEGSIAAPTAGLHFTNELLSKLLSLGVQIETINLEVGLGTFLPVKEGFIENHYMHTENYQIDRFTSIRLNNAINEKRRIIAVGTTVTRTLEDNFGRFGCIKDGNFSTKIFIFPGYVWKAVNVLITNFHLPKSTLLMLVSAFAGKELTMKAYEQAVLNNYRFYSFGDAMLIY